MKCVTSVRVSPGRINIHENECFNLTSVEISPPDATNPNVVWSSSNPSIASVHPVSGHVLGVHEGTATIYATAQDGSGQMDCCTVVVSAVIPISSITLNKTSLTLEKGDNYTLLKTIYPSNATYQNVMWFSSNTDVATVNNGVVHAKARGTAVISVVSTTGNGISASCYVEVTDGILVSSITVSPSSISLVEGETTFLHKSVSPANATNQTVQWSSSNSCIATVNPNSGLVSAQNEGTATIYATAQDGSGKQGCCTVHICKEVKVTSVVLNRHCLTLEKGDCQTLSYTLNPSNATNQTVSWSSNNTNVATVSHGVVYAKAAGTATIRIYAEGGTCITDTCVVTVTEDILVNSVIVNPTSKCMVVGDSTYLSATVYPNNATNKSIRWHSDNICVATVNPTSGLVMAQGAGTATIYATAQDGSGKRGCCTVNVSNAVDIIPVTAVTVSPESTIMYVGESAYLTATVYPPNATDKSVEWSSYDSNILEINTYTGRMTAKSCGTTIVSATTTDGAYVSSAVVSVNNLKIYQTTRTLKHDSCGELAEDLTFNDISVVDLQGMDWINWLDFEGSTPQSMRSSWEGMCTSLFSTAPLESVILDMIDHFMTGSGDNYSNDILTEKVSEHASTVEYIDAVKERISYLLSVYNGDITKLKYDACTRDCHPLTCGINKLPPVFNTADDIIHGLTICLDDLWGHQIEVKSYNKIGNSYTGKLEFTLYDHFGLDEADVSKYGFLHGFRAWYILQHNQEFNGAYKPFVTIIKIEVPFSGTI